MGIQLLTAELKRMIEKDRSRGGPGDTKLPKLQGVVNDISASCSISINILNDLLLIDKIEDGNLHLDLAAENAKNLLEPCIRNFDVQVFLCSTPLMYHHQRFNFLSCGLFCLVSAGCLF